MSENGSAKNIFFMDYHRNPLMPLSFIGFV